MRPCGPMLKLSPSPHIINHLRASVGWATTEFLSPSPYIIPSIPLHIHQYKPDQIMYPSKADDYYPPPPPPPPQSAALPVMTGIPVSITGHYYYPSAPPTAFQMDQSQAAVGPWSTGLCGCCDDVGNCCVTCFCPCITFGKIAEIVDRGSTSCGTSAMLYMLIMCLTGCPCFYSCFYRSKIRAQYRLQDGRCGDCCVHCCCEPCALCQEYRELKRRGFDLSIGWHANIDRQGQGGMVPPAINGGMSR